MRRLTQRQRSAAAVLAVLALALMALDVGGGSLRSAHAGVTGFFGSLYRGTDSALGPARRFVQGLPSAGSNQGRIEALQHRNDDLQAQLAAATAAAAAQARIGKLQLAADSTGRKVLPVRVVALGGADGFDWTVTVNAGSADGVRTDQTVTDGAGLVGRVLHTSSDTSVVLLAADPRSGVGARDARSGEVGIATGLGTSGFSFVPLNPAAAVRAGDQLVTGPTGSTSYVSGLAVGTVSAVHVGNGAIRADVRAGVSPTSLDIVGILLDASAPATGSALAPAGPVRTGGGR